MNRKYKKISVLSSFEKAMATLHKHKFEDCELEETRQTLVRQFIAGALTERQKAQVYKLAAPIRTRHKQIKKRKQKQAHYVYAISDGAFIKIGFAKDPTKRLNDLQTASPSELKLEATIRCERYSKAARLERRIHRKCGQFRVRGEWFTEEAMMVFDSYIND